MNPHQRAWLIVCMLLAFALLACHDEVYEMGVTDICDHGQNLAVITIIADDNLDYPPVPFSDLSTDGGLHWQLSPTRPQCRTQSGTFVTDRQQESQLSNSSLVQNRQQINLYLGAMIATLIGCWRISRDIMPRRTVVEKEKRKRDHP
jgi:hypothetical protein